MKLYIRVLFLLSIILLPARAFAAIRITEIAWMGIAGDNGQFGEWVELYNDSSAPVSLSGWKLYGDGGSQLLYTFSKTIAANGYLLAERTTTSMPDPIPGIDDEHGTFGGGGLSNSGEDIVLKDGTGAIIESLNFAGGWSAGDATTKQTMQWSGTKWMTADPTPKAGAVAAAEHDEADTSGAGDTTETPTDAQQDDTDPDNNSGNDASKNKTIKSAPAKKPLHPKPHIELILPKAALIRTSYSFRPTVYTDTDSNPVGGVYRWNFGDGVVADMYKHLVPISHTYQYAGTYTLWFGYYETAFAEDPLLSISTDIVVSTPDISVSTIEGKAVELENNTTMPIDLSHWVIASGSFRSRLPNMTIIGPRATITIPAAVLRIPIDSYSTLLAPDGSPILEGQ